MGKMRHRQESTLHGGVGIVSPRLRNGLGTPAAPALRPLAWLLAALPLLAPAGALLAEEAPGYRLEIRKSERELLVRQRGRIVKRYPIATGSGGRGDKNMRGDKKTPTGIYRVVAFREQGKFGPFIQLNYPNLGDAWRGYLNERLDAQSFQNLAKAHQEARIPPQNTPLGGQIGLHGLGAPSADKSFIHRNFDWTKGCIALTNSQLRELRQYLEIGTRVAIWE